MIDEFRRSPWIVPDGFQIGHARHQRFSISVDGERAEVEVEWPEPSSKPKFLENVVRFADCRLEFLKDYVPQSGSGFYLTDTGVIVVREGRQTHVAFYDPFNVDLEHMDEGGSVKAPMHGKLVAVFVQPGEKVEKGQRLAIVEAMKMEHVLVAPSDGEVAEIAAEPGAQVAEGARLVVLKADTD